jgi:hypothetical protein
MILIRDERTVLAPSVNLDFSAPPRLSSRTSHSTDRNKVRNQ